MAELNGDVIGQLVQEVFADRDGLKRLLEILLHATMQDEVSRHVGAEPHQRSVGRTGHRNGLKPRKIKTRVGELELALRRHSCDAPRVPREAIAEPPPRLQARGSGAALVDRPTRESA